VIDPIRETVIAPLSQVRAFDRFARELHAWWPREYTWTQNVLADIGIDPKRGGLCFETGSHDFRCGCGRVLDWERPNRLALAWQISPRRQPVPDPLLASASCSSAGSARSDRRVLRGKLSVVCTDTHES